MQHEEVAPKQIVAIKYLIFQAEWGTELAKQIAVALIDESQGFTREVFYTMREGTEYSRPEPHQHACSMHGWDSVNSTTHLGVIMAAAGLDFKFSHHYGAYEDGKFDTMGMFIGGREKPMRYTAWLGRRHYGHGSDDLHELQLSRAEIETIQVAKPRLYPALEDQIPPCFKREYQSPERFAL